MISLRNATHLLLSATVLLGVAGLSGGCDEKGPAEKAGENIDNAASDAGHQLDKAGDKVSDKIDDATKK